MLENKELLSLENIIVKNGNKLILDKISFILHPGELLFLTGPSGCGKSTLLKVIASLMNPFSGNIVFDGHLIETIEPHEYRRVVSYCFQNAQLFGETVFDNLAFPYQIRQHSPDRVKMIACLREVQLSADILDKPISELSGGERQRVALLRNIQYLPQILLLDEVTAALDEENKAIVNQFIHRLIREHEIAVIWVTHDPHEYTDSDRVITLPVCSTEALS